jgi:CRP/FNR family transcriptional regulator
MAGYDRVLYQGYLSKVPTFSTCSPEQLDVVAESGDAVSTEDGHDIVTEGDTTDGFYVITSGSAMVRRGGKELTRLEVGDYFGELSLFDPAPRNASVTAIGTLSCVVLRRSDFARVLDGVPELRDALLRGMARRIHQLDQRA